MKAEDSKAALRKVRRAALKKQSAHEALVAAIWEARAAGLPFRVIGTAADLSHTQVQRLIPEDQT